MIPYNEYKQQVLDRLGPEYIKSLKPVFGIPPEQDIEQMINWEYHYKCIKEQKEKICPQLSAEEFLVWFVKYDLWMHYEDLWCDEIKKHVIEYGLREYRENGGIAPSPPQAWLDSDILRDGLALDGGTHILFQKFLDEVNPPSAGIAYTKEELNDLANSIQFKIYIDEIRNQTEEETKRVITEINKFLETGFV